MDLKINLYELEPLILVHCLKDKIFFLKIKDSIKGLLNKNYNNTDPAVPDFLKDGIEFTMSQLDITGQLKVDPLSETGSLLYNDTQSGLDNTKDFNTFFIFLAQFIYFILKNMAPSPFFWRSAFFIYILRSISESIGWIFIRHFCYIVRRKIFWINSMIYPPTSSHNT